jgi:hypothetical protein
LPHAQRAIRSGLGQQCDQHAPARIEGPVEGKFLDVQHVGAKPRHGQTAHVNLDPLLFPHGRQRRCGLDAGNQLFGHVVDARPHPDQRITLIGTCRMNLRRQRRRGQQDA